GDVHIIKLKEIEMLQYSFSTRLSGAATLVISPGRSDLPETLFVRFENETGAGLHPRDRTLPFTPVLSGAILGSHGYGSHLIEIRIDRPLPQGIITLLEQHEGVVVFEIKMGQNQIVRSLLSRLKKRPPLTAAYGVLVNNYAEAILKEGVVDYCAMGEGEEVIPQLVAWMLQGRKGPAPSGLKFMTNGTIFSTGTVPAASTDDMPFIPLSVLKSNRYYKNSFPVYIGRPLRWGFVLANRGCMFNCNFCTAMTRQSILKDYRLCNPRRLYDEMKYQVEEGGRNIISIEGDLFTGSRQWTQQMCDLLISEGWKHPWIAETRFDCLDEELLHILKRAGCVGLSCGLESGSDKVLKNLNKRETVAKIRQIGALIKKLGFAARCTAMVGAPGETRDDFEETVALIKELNPLTAQMTFCTPYPDTVIAQHTVANPEMMRFEAVSLNLCEIPAQELQRLRMSFYRRFYMSGNYLKAHAGNWLGYSLMNPVRAFNLIGLFALFMMRQIKVAVSRIFHN
ncbi:MAG: radical SAM protein, partial [bacterium]